MCTLIIDFQPDSDWPLMLAGNRDEMRDRPWLPPARHWPDRPEIRAGLDELAQGTWFGVADHGLVASVLNRHGTLGPDAKRHSRGELVLDVLEQASAADAVAALAELNPLAYRGFNLIVGDPKQVFWVCHASDDSEDIQIQEIPPGVHMIDAGDLDDMKHSTRIQRWLPEFQSISRPQVDETGWEQWQSLLARRDPQAVDDSGSGTSNLADAKAALNVDYEGRFGTVCSQIAAIPKHPGYGQKVRYLFAAGAPDRAPFVPVSD